VNNFQYDKIVGVIDDDKIQLSEEIDLRHYSISMCYKFDKITDGKIDPSGVTLMCASLVPNFTQEKAIIQDDFFTKLFNYIKTLFFRGKRCLRKIIKGLRTY
jgi:hypothetical protein